MKYLSHLLIVVFASCGSSQHTLLETPMQDGATAIVTQGVFSGIDYIQVEKKTAKKTIYSLFYNCACKQEQRASLRKDSTLTGNVSTTWVAVTDTVGGFKYFDHLIPGYEIHTPLQFDPIGDEIDLLKRSIGASQKDCCKNELQSMHKIIGYVRVRHN